MIDTIPAKIPNWGICIPSPDGYWTWLHDRETAQFWCELDEDWRPEILSFGLMDFDHTVANEISQAGLECLLGWHCWPTDCELTIAVNLGLTYRQPFLVEATVHYYISHSQEGDEWDCDVSWEILDRVPVAPDRVAVNLEEWLRRDCPGCAGTETNHSQFCAKVIL